MGMFDSVYFEKAPLKCKCGQEITNFQTKQFSNLMEVYQISKNNKLQIENYTITVLTDKEQEEYKKKNNTWFAPFWRKERSGWKTLKWTDTIYCYTFCPVCQKWWFDLEVVFIKGKLDEIKVRRRKT